MLLMRLGSSALELSVATLNKTPTSETTSGTLIRRRACIEETPIRQRLNPQLAACTQI